MSYPGLADTIPSGLQNRWCVRCSSMVRVRADCHTARPSKAANKRNADSIVRAASNGGGLADKAVRAPIRWRNLYSDCAKIRLLQRRENEAHYYLGFMRVHGAVAVYSTPERRGSVGSIYRLPAESTNGIRLIVA